MTTEKDIAHVWDMVDDIGICMLVSREGEVMRSRPMAAYFDREEEMLYFLTDVASHKDEEIARDPHVTLTFADTSKQDYVSITGLAEISNDREKIRKLWATPAKAWWDSPDDPSIRVLKITPQDAQYWVGPGTAVAYFKMAAAAFTSAKPELGESQKVNFKGH